MVSANYLIINIQRYGALQITSNGERVLKGEDEYFYRRFEFINFTKKKKDNVIDAGIIEDEKELLSALKSKRMELA